MKRAANTLERQVVLVTGASTGIGLALVRRLSREPYLTVATAREAALPRLAEAGISDSDNLIIRPLDVTDVDQVERVLTELDREHGGVDILVNNAGVLYRAVQEHMSEAEQREQFAVNYFGPMNLIRHVLPGMREKRRGRIINISSVGGMMAMPTMSLYSASKFALEGASEGLWYELRPWNIAVSLVQPGFINSGGFDRVKLNERARRSLADRDDAYHAHYDNMTRFVAQHMRRSMATSDTVARRILWTMKHPSPPLRVPATPDAWLFSILRRLTPRGFYHWLLYRLLPAISEWGRNRRAFQ